MYHVVRNINVVTEKLRADAIVQKGTLIENRQAAEIEKHKADHIEDSGRFENYGVLTCGNVLRMCRVECFSCSGLGWCLAVDVCYPRQCGFLLIGDISRQ